MTDPVLSSLVRINRQRIRDLRRRLAPCGYLGVMHLIVLYVRRHPGARQEDVACFYAVDKTSVARDARRLEDMGHLRREVDPDNRRQYQLYLRHIRRGLADPPGAAQAAGGEQLPRGVRGPCPACNIDNPAQSILNIPSARGCCLWA